MPTLTGIYGEPLEYVKRLLRRSEAFGAFAPGGEVYLVERVGEDGNPPAAGDGWATLSYEQGDHKIRRAPTTSLERSPRLTLVKCVEKLTEDAKASTMNAVSAIVRDLVNDADADLVSDVELVSFAVDDAAEPPMIGAVLKVRMNL